MKNFDVVALGELLIDFTENGVSESGNPLMEAHPGGAPCNMLAMLRKLGHSAAFIGKVGNDIWGRMLRSRIEALGIDASGLRTDGEVNTTLAFVKTDDGGDREFSFYRNPGADMMLTRDEVNRELIEGCAIFHFGTISMTDEPSRTATKSAVAAAKKAGKLVSFDPNIREALWKTEAEMREQTKFGLANCDILKISDNELEWFTKKHGADEGIAELRKSYDIPLVVLSCGENGSRAYMGSETASVAASSDANVIDTTGAGDTFGACVLHFVLENGWRNYSGDELRKMLIFANAAASVVITRRGAMDAMPTAEEIKEAMKRFEQ